MINLIDEELQNRRGCKCLIIVGNAQFKILNLMTKDVKYDDIKKYHTYKGHQIIQVKEKSFLKIGTA